jgi:hypothetical protein
VLAKRFATLPSMGRRDEVIMIVTFSHVKMRTIINDVYVALHNTIPYYSDGFCVILVFNTTTILLSHYVVL